MNRRAFLLAAPAAVALGPTTVFPSCEDEDWVYVTGREAPEMFDVTTAELRQFTVKWVNEMMAWDRANPGEIARIATAT